MKRGTSGISCLLAIDKPAGLTSHDVVGRVRRLLGERRVGHAGTLDPAATGVLVLGVGQATKLLGHLTLDDKRYVAEIAFGCETDTDDAEGVVVREAQVAPRLADPLVAQAELAALEGEHDQLPPAYSAISVDGRRAYDRARAGEQVELAARHIRIHEAQLLAVGDGSPLTWTCAFHVSKGSYVRSIARDLGRDLGTAAHLSALRRTASGSIGLASCVTLDELAALGPERVMTCALDPVAALGLPTYQPSASELAFAANGRRFPAPEVLDPAGHLRELGQGERVCLVARACLLGIWERRGSQLASVANFPDGIAGVR